MMELALLGAACFVCYLILCAFVVLRTGRTDGLAHVALAVRGLRQPIR